MSSITYFDTSAAIHLRSPSCSPPDASGAPFPHRSPRTAFNRRSMRRFEASPRRATPKGQNLHQLHSTTITWTYVQDPDSSVRGTPVWPVSGASARLIPKLYTHPGFDAIFYFSMLQQWFAHARLSDPCLTTLTPPFPQ